MKHRRTYPRPGPPLPIALGWSRVFVCLGLAWAALCGAAGGVRLVEITEPIDAKPLHEKSAAEEMSISPRCCGCRPVEQRSPGRTDRLAGADRNIGRDWNPFGACHIGGEEHRRRNGFGGPLKT